MKLISVDTETTRLDAVPGSVWEIGLVEVKTGAWMWAEFPVSLSGAEPGALMVNNYYERATLSNTALYARYADSTMGVWLSDVTPYNRPVMEGWREVARVLSGATLLGASVHFDAEHIAAELRAHSLQPSWSHRYLDLGSFYAGWRGMDRPASTKTMEEVVPQAGPAHTALGDAKWNVAVYEQCCGRS